MATTFKKDGINKIKVTKSVVESVPLEEILAEIQSVEESRDSLISHTQEMVDTYNERLEPLYELRDKATELGVVVIEPEEIITK